MHKTAALCCALAIFITGCGGGSGATTATSDNSASTSTGGSSSSGGTLSNASAGCGTSAQFSDGKYSLVSDGVTREFWVSVPSTYSKSHPYPVVVGLHWRGGQASDVYNGGSWASSKAFYGLKELYGDTAIFVAPDGLDNGWANSNNQDIHFMRAMVAKIQQGLCIDNSHIYATGFSFGGMMSNAIGCEMGDTFRAVAPMSGSLWSGCADSSKRVAAIFLHSKIDAVVDYKYGEEARDKYLARNSCTTTTRAIGTNGCMEYQGCQAQYPVVWCGYDGGGHWPPAFAAQEIKTFFDRF
ncbi:alpha/beta hydrolase family esterase [Uliginosibacterium gangwonense]|uniref:alpha/beta hydrolase family esterase n=1 Tax=Uliginosibacterium gangwonense TaxID=392736 RepID=UPI0012FC9D48|nr:prolyl oligopeptidase family serine peptidase [Uliginosibacterium gangwonense]